MLTCGESSHGQSYSSQGRDLSVFFFFLRIDLVTVSVSVETCSL